MTKCLAAGLQRDKVQPLREPNSPKLEKSPPAIDNQALALSLPSISNEYQMVSRDCSKIHETASHWNGYSMKRKRLYGENAEYLNYYELSCLTKADSMIMWQMAEDMFPCLADLSFSDKESLLCNFMSKFFLLESSQEVITWFREPREYAVWTEENRNMLVNFYGGAMPEKQRLQRTDIEKIFWPFWSFYYDKIMIPMYDIKSDLMESIAQLLLVLFDPAYINISEECAQQCRNLRNMVLRELKGYLADKNEKEGRFFEILDTLLLLEKADKKFEEEIQICDLYNVKLHEDFRRICIVEKL